MGDCNKAPGERTRESGVSLDPLTTPGKSGRSTPKLTRITLRGPAVERRPAIPSGVPPDESDANCCKNAGAAALALGASRLPFGWTAPADGEKKHILMYTRSEGYQHSVVTRKDGKLSQAEQIVTDLGAKHGFEVVCEKDGDVFTSKDFPTFDGFVFETQGDLSSEKSLDGSGPITADGKKALLEAVASGKAFVGCHCASDTFHSPGPGDATQPRDKVDPYIAMLGGEFIVHGAQQKAPLIVADPNWPGLKDVKDIEIMEEWYALKNFAPDLHVILVMDTKDMKGEYMYQRPWPYPETWGGSTRRAGSSTRRWATAKTSGRAGISSRTCWSAACRGALGNVEADVTPSTSTRVTLQRQ